MEWRESDLRIEDDTKGRENMQENKGFIFKGKRQRRELNQHMERLISEKRMRTGSSSVLCLRVYFESGDGWCSKSYTSYFQEMLKMW